LGPEKERGNSKAKKEKKRYVIIAGKTKKRGDAVPKGLALPVPRSKHRGNGGRWPGPEEPSSTRHRPAVRNTARWGPNILVKIREGGGEEEKRMTMLILERRQAGK